MVTNDAQHRRSGGGMQPGRRKRAPAPLPNAVYSSANNANAGTGNRGSPGMADALPNAHATGWETTRSGSVIECSVIIQTKGWQM